MRWLAMAEEATVTTNDISTATPEPGRKRGIRFNLEVRRDLSTWQQAIFLGGSILVGLTISGLILVWAGVPADALFEEFVLLLLTDADNMRSVLFQAGPLIMVGLAAAVAFRVRFWNLGLEGQMIWGAIGATFISLHPVGANWLQLPLMILFAAIAAMLWVLISAQLKLKLNVNEIISTLLLNYVALNFLLHLLYGPWRDPIDGFPHSENYQSFERLPDLVGGVNAALPLALVAALIVWWLVRFSRFGFRMKFVQESPSVAAALGIPVAGVTLASVLLSGALAGIAGFVVVSGQEGRLIQNFSHGYLFSGVLIAFLARNNPLAAILVAILVSMLFIAGGSLQVFYQIPFAMVQLIEAIIVICVATSEFLIRHRIHIIR